ncbi:MAG: PAS domain S-box protein [Deltaproteobacteria bacterium]|nr:PAS domain S-box protein [Deltaproteobacteria bacterium]
MRKSIEELKGEIEELKKTVTALRESEEKFRAVTEQSPNMIFINKKGSIAYANARCEEIMGYTRDEFYAPDFDFLSLIAPESRQLIRSSFERHMKGQDIEPYEYVLINKKGEKIDAIITSKLITYGDDIAIVGIVTDITEHKQVLEALRESEEKYRDLYDEAPVGYMELDTEGRITNVNKKTLEMLGYTYEEMAGQFLWTFVLEEGTRERIKAKLCGDLPPSKNLERNYKQKGGTTIPVLIEDIHLRDRNGRVNGIRIAVRDITDLKRAEEEKKKLEAQLVYAQRMDSIGTLAGGIAHNFNNLLMGIQGYTSIMLFNTDSGHPQYNYLMNIEKLVKNGSRLTAQLIGYAMKGKYKITSLNLNHLVENTSNTFGATSKKIRVHRELDEQLYRINADQGQIEHVLLSLFINAADAMADGGDLFLKTMNITNEDIAGKDYNLKPGDYVLLTVRDTGVGMDKETIKRIFEPFFTTKGLAYGTGLGLSSAYGIVKGHGGIIDVDSEKGKGTTFSIYLLATAEKIKEEKVLSYEPVKGEGVILLVDDEDIVLDSGNEMLKILGYEVLTAIGGEEALELYEKNQEKIDMVLLDMVMPGIGGGHTFDRIKEINPEVKVLLSSGYSIDGEAKEILNRGCNGFIQKPFNLAKLSQSIKEVLKNNKDTP